MGTIAEKLQAVLDSKTAIKNKLNTFGMGASDVLSSYEDKIQQLRDTEHFAPLPTTAKTVQMKTGTTSVAVSPHIRIMDANGVSWSFEEWHAKAIENNFDKTLRAAPIAWDIHACGKRFLWFMRDSQTDITNWYDVTGTTLTSTFKLRHSHYQHPLVTGAYTKNDSNGTVATATVDGNELVLSTTNSPSTWRMKKGMGSINAWMADDVTDRFDALYAQSEWFRHRAAIDSGLTTTEADGTAGVVTILNAEGSQAAVGDDMYFYVNGVKSDRLAKYNVHVCMTNDNPTQAIVDAIYAKQIAAGINMNDTGVNSASKKILTVGSKGAEAYAFNGRWMIVTPVLSRAHVSHTTADYNIPDAPAIYYVMWLREYYGSLDYNIICPDWWMGSAYWCNKNYGLGSLRTYLNNANGENWGITALLSGDYVWCSERASGTYAWNVLPVFGYVGSYLTGGRYYCAGAVAL